MSKKARKTKTTSMIPMGITGGLFIGAVLGALMDNLLMVVLICGVIGIGIGYYIDIRNSRKVTHKH
jgi:hypothetical protein